MEDSSFIFPRVFLSSLQLKNIEEELELLSSKDFSEKNIDSSNCFVIKEEVEILDSDDNNVESWTDESNNYSENNAANFVNVHIEKNPINNISANTLIRNHKSIITASTLQRLNSVQYRTEYIFTENPRRIKYYCAKCKLYIERINHKKQTSCQKCGSKMIRQCRKCDARKLGYKAMLRHLKQTHCETEKNYYCTNCEKNFNSEILLKKHELICSAIEVTCEYCEYKSKNHKNMLQHLRRHEKSEGLDELHSKYVFYCSNCDTTVDHNVKRKKFCDTCKKKFLRKCLQCNRRFDRYTDILNHVKNDCLTGYSCPQCGTGVKSYEELEDHFQNCGDDSSYACTKCSFTTVFQETFLSHTETHKQDKNKKKIQNKRCYLSLYTYYCENCRVTNNDKSSPNCLECGSSYICQCIRCKKKYRILHSMICHLRTVCYRAKRKKCYKCDKSFGNAVKLQRHQKYCGKAPKYFCAHCKYDSVTRKNILRHLKNHLEKDAENEVRPELVDSHVNDVPNEKQNEVVDTVTSEHILGHVNNHLEKDAENEMRPEPIDSCANDASNEENHDMVDNDNIVEENDVANDDENEAIDEEQQDTVINDDGNVPINEEENYLAIELHVDEQNAVNLGDSYQDDYEDTMYIDDRPSSKYRRICVQCLKTFDNISFNPRFKSCFTCKTELQRQCLKCNKIFKSYISMKNHIDSTCFVKFTRASCSVCNRIYDNEYVLKKHERYCHKKPTYTCLLCPYSTKYKVDLNYHLKSRHQSRDI